MILLLFGQLFGLTWFDCLLPVGEVCVCMVLIELISECFRFSWLGRALFVAVGLFTGGCVYGR